MSEIGKYSIDRKLEPTKKDKGLLNDFTNGFSKYNGCRTIEDQKIIKEMGREKKSKHNISSQIDFSVFDGYPDMSNINTDSSLRPYQYIGMPTFDIGASNKFDLDQWITSLPEYEILHKDLCDISDNNYMGDYGTLQVKPNFGICGACLPAGKNIVIPNVDSFTKYSIKPLVEKVSKPKHYLATHSLDGIVKDELGIYFSKDKDKKKISNTLTLEKRLKLRNKRKAKKKSNRRK